MLKVSIITATFNNQDTIESTLKSVAEQTYTNIEHIIIDGKSEDKTLSIIKKYPHINKIISEKDKGIYFALNKGIELATGEIIGFLHADDFFADNDVIETIISTFESKNADIVYGNLCYVNYNASKTVRYWQSEKFSKKNLKKGWMPPHPTFYAKKTLFDKFGKFNTDYKISADYDLMTRFLLQTANVEYINKIFVKMRMGGISNNKLSNILQKSKEDYEIIKRNKIGNSLTLIIKNTSKIKQFFKNNSI